MKSSKVVEVLDKVVYHQDGFLVSKETGERVSRLYKGESYYKISCGRNQKIYEHRAIWFLTHGRWPEVIDHINGNRLDNRLENLRECTPKENARNRNVNQQNRKHPLPRNVYKQEGGRFKVLISVEGKAKHLASFTTVEEAARFAEQVRKERYGDFAGSG